MQLNERNRNQHQESNVAKEYIAGLIETIKNWGTLDPEAQQQALITYGYSLGIIIGVPAAGIAAFLART